MYMYYILTDCPRVSLFPVIPPTPQCPKIPIVPNVSVMFLYVVYYYNFFDLDIMAGKLGPRPSGPGACARGVGCRVGI